MKFASYQDYEFAQPLYYRCATELDSFRGYWRYRSFVIIIIIIIIIIIPGQIRPCDVGVYATIFGDTLCVCEDIKRRDMDVNQHCVSTY